jgi:RimJ/RimL family protein N-acetyltransferase
MTLLIRRLQPADADAYRALRLEALRRCPGAFEHALDEEAILGPDDFAQRLDEIAVFGAFVEGRLCGIAAFTRPPFAKKRHKGVLRGVYVAPGIRGEGVGTALVAAVVEHARGEVVQLHAAVATTNAPARRLYARLGFTAYGVEPRALRVDGTCYDQELLVLPLAP